MKFLNQKKYTYLSKKIKNVVFLECFAKLVEYSKSTTKDVKIINDHKLVNTIIPKIIWLYWHDVNAPELISKSVEKISILNPNFEVVFLNKANIHRYIEDCCFLKNSHLSLQTKADLVRLKLIYKYGGIWLDASIICFESMDWVIDNSKINHYDFIGYYRDRLTINTNRPIIENWMIAAPAKNKFINLWLSTFEPIIEIGITDYYKKLSERKDLKDVMQGINMPEYLCTYIAAQIAAKECTEHNMYLRCAEESAYFFQESYPQNDYFLSKIWCQLDEPKSLPPLIKLTGANRKTIDRCIHINCNSIIGQFLK